MKGSFQGTFEVSRGGAGPVIVLIVLALLFGSGAAAVVSAAVVGLLIAVGAVIVLCVAGLAALVVWRVRRSPAIPAYQGIVRPPVVHQLAPEPERPAIAAPQELHVHFHGTDTEGAAALLRRIAGEE